MATGDSGQLTITLPCSAAMAATEATTPLSTQFCAVGIDSAGRAILIQGNTSPAGVIIGILQNHPNAIDKPAVIQVSGKSKFKAGGALATIGTKLSSTAAGRAIAYATTDCIVGIQLSVAGADGDVIDVLINPMIFID